MHQDKDTYRNINHPQMSQSKEKISRRIHHLLCCCGHQVRDGAMSCLVEIYRHVGERVRMDLSKKGLPQSRYANPSLSCLLLPSFSVVFCLCILSHPLLQYVWIRCCMWRWEISSMSRHKEEAGDNSVIRPLVAESTHCSFRTLMDFTQTTVLQWILPSWMFTFNVLCLIPLYYCEQSK